MSRNGTRTAVLGLVTTVLVAAALTGCGEGAQDNPRTVLQAFDAADGHVRWSVEMGATDGATEPVIVGNSVISGSPSVPATAYALDDGRVRWTVPGGALPDAVTTDLAVFSLGGRLEARRADTGAVAWTRQTAGRLIRSHDAGPLALVVEGTVSLLDPATGQDRWKAALPGRVDVNASAVSTRHILATYAVDHSGAGVVAALLLKSGRRAWSFPSPSVGYVTAAAGIPAVISGLDPGRATVLDPATGEKLWEAPIAAASLRGAPFVEAGPDGVYRRDPRTGAALPGRVPVTYGFGALGARLVGAADHTLTATKAADQVWTAILPAGPRPITYVDLDANAVVALTSVGQEKHRD